MAPRHRSPQAVDDVSRAIIEQLQQDGRRPYGTIGRAVGLSEAAVRQRVARLIDTGVMQVVAVTDPMNVGFSRAAMVGIEVDGDIEAVADALESLAEVDYLVIVAGSFDLGFASDGNKAPVTVDISKLASEVQTLGFSGVYPVFDSLLDAVNHFLEVTQ